MSCVTFLCASFEGEVRLSDEHVEHLWMSPESLEGRLTPARPGRARRVRWIAARRIEGSMSANTAELRPSVADHVEQYSASTRAIRSYAEALGDVLRLAAGRIAPLAIVQARAKSIASFAPRRSCASATRTQTRSTSSPTCAARGSSAARAPRSTRSAASSSSASTSTGRTAWSTSRAAQAGGVRLSVGALHRDVPSRHRLRRGDPRGDLRSQGRGPATDRRRARVLGFRPRPHLQGRVPAAAGVAARARGRWQRRSRNSTLSSPASSAVLREYATSYGAYLSEKEIRAEIERLEIVLDHDAATSVSRSGSVCSR